MILNTKEQLKKYDEINKIKMKANKITIHEVIENFEQLKNDGLLINDYSSKVMLYTRTLSRDKSNDLLQELKKVDFSLLKDPQIENCKKFLLHVDKDELCAYYLTLNDVDPNNISFSFLEDERFGWLNSIAGFTVHGWTKEIKVNNFFIF